MRSLHRSHASGPTHRAQPHRPLFRLVALAAAVALAVPSAATARGPHQPPHGRGTDLDAHLSGRARVTADGDVRRWHPRSGSHSPPGRPSLPRRSTRGEGVPRLPARRAGAGARRPRLTIGAVPLHGGAQRLRCRAQRRPGCRAARPHGCPRRRAESGRARRREPVPRPPGPGRHWRRLAVRGWRRRCRQGHRHRSHRLRHLAREPVLRRGPARPRDHPGNLSRLHRYVPTGRALGLFDVQCEGDRRSFLCRGLRRRPPGLGGVRVPARRQWARIPHGRHRGGQCRGGRLGGPPALRPRLRSGARRCARGLQGLLGSAGPGGRRVCDVGHRQGDRPGGPRRSRCPQLLRERSRQPAHRRHRARIPQRLRGGCLRLGGRRRRRAWPRARSRTPGHGSRRLPPAARTASRAR